MAEIAKKHPYKINSISLALNLALVLAGILVSLGSLLMIWDDKNLSAIWLHLVNHMVIYVSVVFYTCYGYRIKQVNLIRIIACVFAVLMVTASIIFLAKSDIAVPMAIFTIIAAVAIIYFAIRCDKTMEAYIALAIALLFLIIYAISGCATLEVDKAQKEYRIFYGLSMFGPFIVCGSIAHSYFITKNQRALVINSQKPVKK